MQFVSLTDAFRKIPVSVNLDLVRTMTRFQAVDDDYSGRAPERTELWFRGYGDDRDGLAVVETPEQIAALADPKHAPVES